MVMKSTYMKKSVLADVALGVAVARLPDEILLAMTHDNENHSALWPEDQYKKGQCDQILQVVKEQKHG